MNHLSSKLLLVIISFLFAETCFSAIYKWTDNNGVVHFGERPPNEGESESIIVDVAPSTSVKQSETKAQKKTIVMYGAEWCGYCKKARLYFKQKDIKFIEYDVEKLPSKMRDFKRFGGTGYPLILIGQDDKMKGFNISHFERIYNS